MAKVLVPTPLRSCTDGHPQVEVGGDTVASSMQSLVEVYPRLQSQLFDDAGALRSFVNLFLNDEDVRMLGGHQTPVSPADTVEILPAIAGGSDKPEDFASRKRRLEDSVDQISVEDLASGVLSNPVRIDVRGGDEWAEGHLPGAIHIDRGFLELKIEQEVPDRSHPVLVYCQSGTRSLLAADTLQNMGYSKVWSLSGGVQAWKAAGQGTVVPARLSEEKKRRYSRHLTMPEIGPKGQ
ncbi:MAG: rhodanese-like domain-containing protein, partial [Pseudomonadota bacterium]